MLSLAKAELLWVVLDGGRIEGRRTYPGAWRHVSTEKVAEGKPPKEKPVGDATLVDLAERGYLLGKFVDIGGNEHRISYTVTPRGREAVVEFENDPANADAIRRRDKRREKQRGAA